jgi:hypothetical protein
MILAPHEIRMKQRTQNSQRKRRQTMKMQQRTMDWIFSGLIILAAVAVIVTGGTRVSASSETAPQIFAQATQLTQGGSTVQPRPSGPSGLKQKTTPARVLCGGKTTKECCDGIAFCGCLVNPMPKKGDEDKPLSCESSPPPSKG